MNDTECTAAAAPFQGYMPFRFVLLTHVILGIIGISLSIYSLGVVRRSFFHPNCKILLLAIVALFIAHGVGLSVPFSYHVYAYSTMTGCQLMVSEAVCDIIRAPANFAVFGCSSLHFGLCLERIMARYYARRYETMRPIFGWGLLGASLLTTVLINAYCLHREDFSMIVPYCTLGNANTVDQLDRVLKILPSIDLASVIVMVYLAVTTKNSKKTYDLGASFSKLEGRSANRLLLPFTIVHLVIGLGAVFLNGYLPGIMPVTWTFELRRTVLAGLNLISVYAIIGCLTLLHILRNIQRKRRQKIFKILTPINDTSVIHNTYAQHW
ncbi:unnamed protein product, partial [Mesorhabditis spiculigera]